MSRRTTSFRALLGAGAAFAAFAAVPAFAQDEPASEEQAAQAEGDASEAAADESDIDEIVVIARKREERLVDVPIAITALSAEDLARQQAIDLSGVQGTIPNVNIVQGRGSTSSANIFIRGVGQPDALQTFDPAVGIYVDGVYISRIQGALFNLYDVDHIEVLRGPQGTLYGKNTIGGAINIVSKKPDLNDLHASGSLTYGSYDQWLVNGYVSAPLIADKLALSIAGVYDKRDGTVTDPLTGEKYNDRNNQAVRGILRAEPSDRLSVTIEADYERQRTDLTLGYPTAPLIAADIGTGAVTVLSPPYPYGDYDYKASTSLTGSDGQDLDHWGIAGTIDYELGDALTLTSITAYRDLVADFFIDIDATQFALGDVFVGVDQHQFSQELQLKYDSGPLQGVFGLYYLHENVGSHQEAYADDYLRLLGTPLDFIRYIDDDQKTDSYAAFGQLTYDLTDRLSITGGLRYTRETKQYNRLTTTRSAAFPLLNGSFAFPDDLPAPYNSDDDVSFDAWTPSVALSYKPTPDTLLYVSAARGFKSGGFNGRVNSLADVTRIVDGQAVIVPYFKPETVWTYEAGAKGDFLDGRVFLSGDVFYSDYENFQARVGGGRASAATAGSFPVLNAGKLRIWGVEAEMAIQPIRDWNIRSSFGYLNAEYVEFDDARRPPLDAFSCNPTGNEIVCEPAFSPPITFSLGTDYAIGLGGAGTLTLGGDTRFVDKHFLSVDNRPGLMEDGYWLLNAFVQYDAPDDTWYLRGGVKNLTETLYKTDGQEFSSVANIQTVYYGDPRTWSITAGFRF